MTSQLKVSVIVPIFNAGAYLKQCLTALQVQTLKEIEFIMVDNCSTDDSRAIMKEYADKDSRFKCVYNRFNMGQNHSMITGLKEAQGEYVAECDADDFVLPQAYELLYTFAKNFDLDVSHAGWFDFTDEALAKRELVSEPSVFSIDALSDKKKMWFLGFQCHIMSAIYRTEWIRQNNLWYREAGIYEDTSLSFKIRTKAKKYGMLPGCLYFYRRDNVQSGTFTVKQPFGICEQFDEIIRFHDAEGLDLRQFISVMRFYTYRWQKNRLALNDKIEFIMQGALDFREDNCDRKDLFLTEDDWRQYDEWRRL